MKGKPETNSKNPKWTKKAWKIVYFSSFKLCLSIHFVFVRKNIDKLKKYWAKLIIISINIGIKKYLKTVGQDMKKNSFKKGSE